MASGGVGAGGAGGAGGLYGPLRLGCPQWAHRPWSRSIFPSEARERDALAHYARVFTCVEGNTTFYATPPAEVVRRWASQTPPSFRLLLKLPQEVTHERLLGAGALDAALRFLDHMAPLGPRAEDALVQLPARFDARRLDDLYRFLTALPRGELAEGAERAWRGYAVEVRDPALCAEPLLSELNALLSAARVERAWMDTRPLRASPPPHAEATRVALERKPNLPVFPVGLGPRPVVRYVAHVAVGENLPWLEAWAGVFARWLDEGRAPYFFAHYPGETLAPEVARLFYERLRALRPALPPPPGWPSEEQLGLF